MHHSIGCIVLYTGQGKFHRSTTETLGYVVGQANITVENLRNFSDYLSAAKKIGVDQVFLPGNIQGQIDEVVTKVNSSANSLDSRTSDNSKKIKDLLDTVYECNVCVVFCCLALLWDMDWKMLRYFVLQATDIDCSCSCYAIFGISWIPWAVMHLLLQVFSFHVHYLCWLCFVGYVFTVLSIFGLQFLVYL